LEEFLERLDVEGLVGDQPVKAGIVVLQYLEPLRVAGFQSAVLLLPLGEGLGADAVVAVQRDEVGPRPCSFSTPTICSAENRLRRMTSSSGPHAPRGLSLSVNQFSGGGHVYSR